jgi:NAD(P)-dependent dehydrogenase (short-subunit alcohol dehydrogenase family)
MSLDGRVALITGGAGEIGGAIAEAFLEAGGSIALADCRVPTDGRDRHDRTAFFDVDLRNASMTQGLVDKVVAKMGRLDIVVHCAALVGTSELAGWAVPLAEQGLDAWDQAIRVNLTAAFVLAQAARDTLAQSGRGSIIFISSIYGMTSPDPSMYTGTTLETPAAYSASKAGLLQLARHLATYYAPAIRVNAISPGGVRRSQPAAFVERYEKRTPLARMASEEDVKGAAIYLASDLSAYVTGQNIVVDGGWTVK